jgi:hypothetical protein
MPDDRARSRQRSQNKSTSQQNNSSSFSLPEGKSTAHFASRKNKESPKQKFERLLAEGHKAQKKQIASGNSDETMALDIISPEGAIDIIWLPNEKLRSGAFSAIASNETANLKAKLEDEADSKIYKYSDKGSVTTHVLPLGEIGDTTYFEAVNSVTGECAVSKSTTFSIEPDGSSIGSWVKKLFS